MMGLIGRDLDRFENHRRDSARLPGRVEAFHLSVASESSLYTVLVPTTWCSMVMMLAAKRCRKEDEEVMAAAWKLFLSESLATSPLSSSLVPDA